MLNLKRCVFIILIVTVIEKVSSDKHFTYDESIYYTFNHIESQIPEQISTPAHPMLNVIFQWKQLEFDYADVSQRQRAIESGTFAVGTFGPIDVEVYYSSRPSNNRIFITVPRFTTGVPASLGTVTNSHLDGNPIIKPYPSWSWHQRLDECQPQRLVSVFRVKVDECNRLWVLDSGKIGTELICQPQILIFDPETDNLVHRYEFPPSVLSPISLLITPAVDVRDADLGCGDTFVYIADVKGFGIVVYDLRNDKSWRAVHRSMYPFPSFGFYNIAGESFELMDGIFGLGLSPYRSGEDRKLFYHALASPTENWIYTSHLRNYSIFANNSQSPSQIFHTYSGQRKTQSAAEAIDSNGIMFFGLLSDTQIACWNIEIEYHPKNFDVVASDVTSLQFPSGIKVIKNNEGIDELWVMTSRFQKIANGNLNPNETNFRILAGRVDDLLVGKKCKRKQRIDLETSK
ncbi:major royal jelly protein 3-like isoform X2 [Cylas formicarius]|uniref:major royal jelly protein 3-like isoform X2 n=1 Tax=Cylas formicarius TaxID=197179 RepID=UPI00295860AD|nr:major royal jelly protein 3-like isoform X2 [Cylas formicarius]